MAMLKRYEAYMTRKEELEKYIGKDAEVYGPLIEDVVFLEEQLRRLRQYPFIKVHPDDPSKQKATPAARQYKDLLGQYIVLIKALEKTAGGGSSDSVEASPFRRYLALMEGDNGNV